MTQGLDSHMALHWTVEDIHVVAGCIALANWLDCDRCAVFLKRALGRIQDLDYTHAIPPIAQRLSALADARQEMQAFEPQGFIDLQVRGGDIAEPQGDVFGEGV